MIDWPMRIGFGPVADALCTYCAKTLRSVHWHIPCENLPKVIWSLDTLQALRSVHITIQAPATETVHLGSATNLHLTLKNVEQLSLRGHLQEFVEQITGWSLPSLRGFSLDSFVTNDLPDVMDFLMQHGSNLIFLDLNCPQFDTPAILDVCPLLTTFTFNADGLPDAPGRDANAEVLVNRPHQHIARIGCHGLHDAFGVGFDDRLTESHRFANEKNMAALTKSNFPKLEQVRVLSRSLLKALERIDGPDAECMPRWDRWWAQFYGMGVRLEDCTGALLGTLPEVERVGDEGDDSSDSEADESDGQDEEMLEGQPRLRQGTLNELRELLEECWKMSETREEPSFPQLNWT